MWCLKHLNELANTEEEHHSIIVGWCEAINPIYAMLEKPNKVKKMLAKEWWYYGFGLVMGIFTWIIILIGAILILGG